VLETYNVTNSYNRFNLLCPRVWVKLQFRIEFHLTAGLNTGDTLRSLGEKFVLI
jgi:hypothetical protein